MDNKLKIIIVDDHDMFRAGVKILLGESKKVEFIGEASNGQEFLKLLETLNPDVVLMDISMPVLDGIEATQQAVKLKPDLKILTLSMFGEEEYYYKMIQSGARGFILKSAGINELEYAIRQVANGLPYFSDELLDFVRRNIDENQSNEIVPELTDAEIKILKLIAKNLSDNEIADELEEPIEVVQKIRTQLFVKTGSNNTSGLVMYAIKQKIIVI